MIKKDWGINWFMVIKAILTIILLVGLGFGAEKALSFLGYGFTFWENATILLAVIVLILLNRLYELKEECDKIKSRMEEDRVSYIEGVEDLRDSFTTELEQKKQDRETFDRIMKALPQNGSIAFLRTGGYLITLFDPKRELKDLLDLQKKLSQGAFIFYFYDEQLEKLKNDLMKSLPRMLLRINTCLAKNSEEDVDYHFDLDVKPSNSKYKDIAEEVSAMVGDFLVNYDSLRRVAKNNLGCS